MGDFMIGDGSARTPEDDGAWKSKVKSLDDTLKSLRDGAPKSKPKASKPGQPAKAPARGLFRFRDAKT